MKRTPWFHGTVEPVHRGVYEREYGAPGPHYCYWDGHEWKVFGRTPFDARRQCVKSGTQNLPWRGVEK